MTYPQRAEWSRKLSDVLRELERRWSLLIGAEFENVEKSCAWVALVTLADGTRAVLKIGIPHFEAGDEIHGLRFWDGDGIVRLLASDRELNAMLLERCVPGTPLRAIPEPAQDIVIAGLLRRLWRVPSPAHGFRSLSLLTDYWTKEALAAIKHSPDPGLVREALQLFNELARSARTQVLLATDLHAGNVLRAERERWLAIDPKPFVGDPAYDLTQHLLNCPGRLRSDPKGMVRRLSDLCCVDNERVRLWTFARVVAGPRDDWSNEDFERIGCSLAP